LLRVARISTASANAKVQEKENSDVGHSQFLSEAPLDAKWQEKPSSEMSVNATKEELETLEEGKGMLTDTLLYHDAMKY
jgi:hypothetical protein